jgi:hypothetical protein
MQFEIDDLNVNSRVVVVAEDLDEVILCRTEEW